MSWRLVVQLGITAGCLLLLLKAATFKREETEEWLRVGSFLGLAGRIPRPLGSLLIAAVALLILWVTWFELE